ncbi:MAG TPA: hypothetical protein DCZ03_06530 [Gammaproteobacteria bacterium]|nr:hypothetical protein [Gammaproteobacteria bacterium]
MRRPTEGMHLIELLLVLAILAILALAAIPAYKLTTERHRIKAATEHLLNALRGARREAQQSNQEVYFRFSPHADCVGVSRQQPCECGVVSGCTQNLYFRKIDLTDYPGVKMQTNLSTQTTFFAPDRGTIGRLGRIRLWTDNYELHIILSMHRIRACVVSQSKQLPGYLDC